RPDIYTLSLHDALPIFALGETVRAGEVQLEGVDARGLAALDDLNPAIFAALFHDRRDEDAIGVVALEAAELVFPDLDGAIADELDRKSTRLNSSHVKIS